MVLLVVITKQMQQAVYKKQGKLILWSVPIRFGFLYDMVCRDDDGRASSVWLSMSSIMLEVYPNLGKMRVKKEG